MSSPILLVEDDFDIRESLRELLEGEGYAVVAADNGKAALESLRHSKRPCVVLLDLMMPVMDGWVFMQRLREDERYASIPVVVVSATGGHDAPLGIARFIKKPYKLDTLLETVGEFCRSGKPAAC